MAEPMVQDRAQEALYPACADILLASKGRAQEAMVMKRVILAGLMATGVATAANAGLDCTSDAIRKVALDLAGREVDPGIPLSNITDVRTISRTRDGIVCEVVVKWADKEWERYRVNVGRSGTVR